MFCLRFDLTHDTSDEEPQPMLVVSKRLSEQEKAVRRSRRAMKRRLRYEPPICTGHPHIPTYDVNNPFPMEEYKDHPSVFIYPSFPTIVVSDEEEDEEYEEDEEDEESEDDQTARAYIRSLVLDLPFVYSNGVYGHGDIPNGLDTDNVIGGKRKRRQRHFFPLMGH